MKFANANKLDRKSGVRFGERGTRPVFNWRLWEREKDKLRFAESHISRKTSEIPGFPVRYASQCRVCGFH
jgi:hypothetical protein